MSLLVIPELPSRVEELERRLAALEGRTPIPADSIAVPNTYIINSQGSAQSTIPSSETLHTSGSLEYLATSFEGWNSLGVKTIASIKFTLETQTIVLVAAAVNAIKIEGTSNFSFLDMRLDGARISTLFKAEQRYFRANVDYTGGNPREFFYTEGVTENGGSYQTGWGKVSTGAGDAGFNSGQYCGSPVPLLISAGEHTLACTFEGGHETTWPPEKRTAGWILECPLMMVKT